MFQVINSSKIMHFNTFEREMFTKTFKKVSLIVTFYKKLDI